MTTKPIPDDYHAVTPYLLIKGAAEAIEFYKRAFGATELLKVALPDGKIGHTEIKIGDSRIMMADDCGTEGAFRNPQSSGGTSVGLHLYVENVDALFARAVDAGAKVVRPVQDQFYGDRMGTLQDPFGHIWFIATHKEDVSPDEIRRRAESACKQST
ncbi:VOC family protein [Nitrosospira sp. NpAV]|uniref:VOC family protein n=1 Tax=Nitrosospira sp. NpAV TaxID=58133 RepID=UPI00059F7B85|nr:VOC family protein [Nitrosospira sp. NpAV]KIO48853.1 glyoxalase [Nitrosospira sp. NpAV]